MAKDIPSYWDQLKDPRWQQQRLKVMERDAWACRECGDTSTTLNVHHVAYIKGLMAWEYPACMLKTLCEPCHEKTEQQLQRLRIAVGMLELSQMDVAFGWLTAKWMQRNPPANFVFTTIESQRGVAEAFDTSVDVVQAATYDHGDGIGAACNAGELWLYANLDRLGETKAPANKIAFDDFAASTG